MCQPSVAQRGAGLEEEEELELGQVWQVLTFYRRYDGFTMEQCQQFQSIFEEHCDQDGEMESIEVPKALRCLGFKEMREVYRQNGGFSPEELKELQVLFDRHLECREYNLQQLGRA
eukprot:Skav227651  [mRNA]  locus=scaffold58:378724:382961:+ [translate_table: standard]